MLILEPYKVISTFKPVRHAVCSFFFASLCAFTLTAEAVAADYEFTYTGPWRDSADVVNGWDWTLPRGVKPARNSGIYNLNTRVPSDFPGRRLKQVNAKWSQLEPVEGKYDFSFILDALNDSNYDGILLNVRGMVVDIRDANGQPIHTVEITAPEWLSSTAPTIREGLKGNFRVTNLQIYNSRVKSKFIQLIKALGRTSIPGDPRLIGQIVHGVSNSRGEEWTGKQANQPEAIAAMEEIILAWGNAYGPNVKKLAWMKEDPYVLFNAAVNRMGMGIRGGAIEMWLRHHYTPGNASETGQRLDANGYLSVNESFAPIAEGRTFLDENEAYREGSGSPQHKWRQNYRLANLRMLQMRRNIAWTERDSKLNPRMLNWMSLGLGQKVKTAPDAWVLLMRTWSRHAGEDREINNLERWLYQHDINGVKTTPRLKTDHGFNAANNNLLPKSLWNIDMARSGPKIGIGVDDAFLSGGPHSVAVKVTYFDNSAERWSLVYEKSGGGSGSVGVTGSNSGQVKTATFFIKDFAARKSNANFDFSLESPGGKTPFMFVRVIKLGAGSNDARTNVTARPLPPTDVQVQR
jgi:hypothetical protein